MVVNAERFGLEKNGDQLQTKAIQSAIDFCIKNGGGTVEIPEGEYHTGDIRIRSNITLHLLEGAKVIGSRNPEDYFNYRCDSIEPLTNEQITDAPYVHLSTIHGETEYNKDRLEYRFKRVPGSRWNNAIIRAINAENIKIIGEKNSVINGNNCFDDIDSEEGYRGPHGITFFNCTNIELKGYTIQNTGNWAHNMLFCDNIAVDSITVLAGHDGFDASVCSNLKILNSEFYTGDDCIAGFGNINTYVGNCVLNSSCSAMRFGATNALVEKCRIYGPGRYCFRGSMSNEEKRSSAPSPNKGARNNMLSAFTYYADYSLPITTQPGNIVISNCQVDMADRFLHYNYSGNETWQKNRPLENIEFKNINANGISMPITAYGDETVHVNIKFTNVEITVRDGCGMTDLVHVCNYDNITFENVMVHNFKGDCIVKTWSEGDISFKNVECNAECRIKSANEEFFADTI